MPDEHKKRVEVHEWTQCDEECHGMTETLCAVVFATDVLQYTLKNVIEAPQKWVNGFVEHVNGKYASRVVFEGKKEG